MQVFLADDHALVREGLRRVLDEAGDITVVGEAADGETVLSRAATERWDVLVLDLDLAGLSGFEVLRKVLEIRPKLHVLVLSMHPEEQFAVRLIRAGASGYLSKGRSATEFVRALREVHAGHRYVAPELAGELIATTDSATLSDREMEVLTLLANGRSPSEIGHTLDLRASTVSTHLAHIKSKLGAKTLVEVVNQALQRGLVSRPGAS
jgi:DNA-binding NarL/FixJ family response regulator